MAKPPETRHLVRGAQLPIADRLRAGGLAADDIVVVGGHAIGAKRVPSGLRERFQAITGIGLSPTRAETKPPRRHHLPGDAATPAISYLAAGDPTGQPVVFVHGTPGEASDWAHFLDNVPRGQYRIAVDRPGFGSSGPGAPVAALTDQARPIAALLEARLGPSIVVGSSYGGPVALQLAAQHRDVVSGVVLVGAAADPARERVHPVQRLAAFPPFSALLPRALAHSNAELLALRAELGALETGLGDIRTPVTILQGLHDTLVPAENAVYLADRLANAARRRVVLVERAGHFLHLLMAPLVEDALGQMAAGNARPAQPSRMTS